MRHSPQKEKEQESSEKRAYDRLKQRKADKPYYQRYYAIYISTLIIGWVANLLSGMTESSKIYAFTYDLLGALPYGNELTWVSVIATVVMIEIFHRLIARSYFKDLVENDLHKRDMTPKLIAMLAIASFSTLLSFNGGFDLIRLTKQAPAPLVAETISTHELTSAYSPLLDDLKTDIADFRKTRQWQGRLSDDSAGKWEVMKQNKQQVQLEQAEALKNLAVTNLETQAQTDSLNQYRSHLHETHINDRGYGLGFLTILAVIILYVCLWYDEEYQERKAVYLEQKYGAMNTPLPSLQSNQNKTPVNAPTASQQVFPSPSHQNSSLNGSQVKNSGLLDDANPIGFYTEAQRVTMNLPYQTQQKPSGQAWTELDRPVQSQITKETDRYTVEHRYIKGGKENVVHYSLRMVNSRIGQYEREIQEAHTRKLGEAVLKNRQNWLKYWQEKQQELLKKIR